MGRDSGYAILGIGGLASVIVLGCSITIICLVRYNLHNVLWACSPVYNWWYPSCTYVNLTCLIGDTATDQSNCSYAYAIGAVGILFSCFQLCALCGGKGVAFAVAELITSLLGLAWWIPAAIVMTQQSSLSNDKDWPQESYRSGVMAVCWIAVGIYGLLVIASFISCRKARRDGGGGGKGAGDQEPAGTTRA